MMLINGELQQTLSALDRGLGFGDGIFRTLECRDGLPLLWRWQIDRLRSDASALGLALPDLDLLRSEVMLSGCQYIAVSVVISVLGPFSGIVRRAVSGKVSPPTAQNPSRRIRRRL